MSESELDHVGAARGDRELADAHHKLTTERLERIESKLDDLAKGILDIEDTIRGTMRVKP